MSICCVAHIIQLIIVLGVPSSYCSGPSPVNFFIFMVPEAQLKGMESPFLILLGDSFKLVAFEGLNFLYKVMLLVRRKDLRPDIDATEACQRPLCVGQMPPIDHI